MIFAEGGDGLAVRRQLARQPHHLDVAPGLPLQPAARRPARNSSITCAGSFSPTQASRQFGKPREFTHPSLCRSDMTRETDTPANKNLVRNKLGL
jgi:hypothetical protein